MSDSSKEKNASNKLEQNYKEDIKNVEICLLKYIFLNFKHLDFWLLNCGITRKEVIWLHVDGAYCGEE
jgi:glutamate/tyrosine decarboxylase-like PLP-dependent enzyme